MMKKKVFPLLIIFMFCLVGAIFPAEKPRDNFLVPAYGLIINSYNLYDKTNDLVYFAVKPWIKFNLGENKEVFFRGRDNYSKFVKKDEFVENDSENVLDLDLGFFSYDDTRYKFRIGRAYSRIGQGLLLDSRADGLTFEFSFSIFRVSALVVYSGLLQADYNPFNLSDRDLSDGAERLFAGTSLGLNVINQLVDFIFLQEVDFAGEKDGISYNYTVNYTGVSASGSILDRLHYTFEGYFQTGKSHLNGTESKTEVRAFGEVAKLFYFFPGKTKPALFVEYAYGSGDGQRESALSPIGNQKGIDKGFIHFGTFQNGLGLRPYLSNIQVADIGVSLIPLAFNRKRIFQDLQIIFKVLRFWKANKAGGINYGEGLNYSSDVGTGIDTFIGWRLSAEFSILVAYGFFKPGQAYDPDEKNRHIFLTGVNLSI